MAKKMAKKNESYIAHASVKAGASAATIQSAYKIEVRFLGGLNTAQKNAFKAAADRWSKVIVGDVPSVIVGGEVIDDLLIEAQGVPIDGPGKILGQAGPTNLRPASAGANAFLPAKGIMSFDTADLAQMQANGTLLDVITHEMGHVIGIGTIWPHKGLLAGAGTVNPRFTGTNAKREFGILKGTGPVAVPVENTGGPGTQDSHWREAVFKNELMSGFIAAPINPLSKMTAASLNDLGYVVNMSAAEPYFVAESAGNRRGRINDGTQRGTTRLRASDFGPESSARRKLGRWFRGVNDERSIDVDHMLRPKAMVLPESAVVPDRNLSQPPPTQFTHEVVAEQPYYYIGPRQAAPPEGKFPAGTKVVLLAHDGGPVCQVVDGRGLCVATAFDGLRPLR